MAVDSESDFFLAFAIPIAHKKNYSKEKNPYSLFRLAWGVFPNHCFVFGSIRQFMKPHTCMFILWPIEKSNRKKIISISSCVHFRKNSAKKIQQKKFDLYP